MQLKDILVKLIELHGILLDESSSDASKSEALEEIKNYTASTYTPVSQLAKAILKIGLSSERFGRSRKVLVELIRAHDDLSKAIQIVSTLPSDVDGSDPRFLDMVNGYENLREITSSIMSKGTRGDEMIVDAVLTSLGMADSSESEEDSEESEDGQVDETEGPVDA